MLLSDDRHELELSVVDCLLELELRLHHRVDGVPDDIRLVLELSLGCVILLEPRLRSFLGEVDAAVGLLEVIVGSFSHIFVPREHLLRSLPDLSESISRVLLIGAETDELRDEQGHLP